MIHSVCDGVESFATRLPFARSASQPSQFVRLGFLIGDEAEPDHGIVQLIGVGRFGPGLGFHAPDGIGVELAEVRGIFRRQPATRHHGLGAAFLEWCVVEIGIRPRREHLERERRRLIEVARHDLNGAGFDARQEPLQAGEIHRLGETVVDASAAPADDPESSRSPGRFSAQAI